MTITAQGGERPYVLALRCDVAYNTPGIGSGLLFGRIPANSVIIGVKIDVTTAFNAATTNVLTIGTSATATEICDASAVAETAGSQFVQDIAAFTAGLTATTPLYVKFAETGTAATAGAATIVVLYVPALPSNTPTALNA